MVPSAGSHQPTFRASPFLATGGQVEFTGRQRLEPLNCALMRRIALPTSGTFRAGPPIWEIEKGRGAVTRLRNCSPTSNSEDQSWPRNQTPAAFTSWFAAAWPAQSWAWPQRGSSSRTLLCSRWLLRGTFTCRTGQRTGLFSISFLVWP
jgi:hypothetical protein